MSELADVPPGVDPTRPSPARLYDYFLGGTNNFPADREAAEYLRSRIPDVADALWANRGFHGRAAVWMANHGIRQFLDIGAGLPTQNNTHESVHRIDPEARVVYVDNDPMVAAHAGALLDADGTTAVILADLRDPKALLSNPDLLRLIDLAEPAGILLTDVMHFVPDEEDPWGLVAQYMAAVPIGSYLALSHGTSDFNNRAITEAGTAVYANATAPLVLRGHRQVAALFEGWDLVEPGVVQVPLWRPDGQPHRPRDLAKIGIYGGVGRLSR